LVAIALDDDEANLLLLAFFLIFMAVSTWQRRILAPLDLLELSTSATTLPFVMVAAWLQQFDERFWWVEPHQYVYHDVVEDDVWHMSHDMLDKKYFNTFHISFLAFE